jgi:selenocysteine lyase/cysteine desulfurase
VARPLAHLAAENEVVVRQAVGDEHGRMTPAALDEALAAGVVDAVVTLHASNVHGLAQDLSALGEVCRQHDVLFIVDAAQSAGALPLDARAMHIDALCVTGHKALLGPTGTGALLLSPRLAERLPPLLHGGTGSVSEQERMPDFLPDRLEAGTPNTHGLAGLLAGVRYVARRTVAEIEAHDRALRERLLGCLRAIPGLRLLGDASGPATSTVSFTGPLPAGDFARLLSERYGVAVRAGLHCAARAHRTLGTFPTGAVRLSPGLFTPPDAIDEVCAAVAEIAKARP